MERVSSINRQTVRKKTFGSMGSPRKSIVSNSAKKESAEEYKSPLIIDNKQEKGANQKILQENKDESMTVTEE